MKKLLFITLLVSALLFSFCFAASRFSDVNGTKYEAAVTKLSNSGVIDGFTDGTFKPQNNVTRAQLCKLLVEALKLRRANNNTLTQFKDINTTMWFYDYVKIAVDNGIIVGYPDGTFRPNDDVKYSEMFTMIIRAMNMENQISNKSDWPNAYIRFASSYGLLSNVAYSDVNLPAIRGEVSIALYNMVNRLESSSEVISTSYGFVESASSRSARIDGVTYSISSKSNSFVEDTYVAFEKSNISDEITLIASYGVKDLDANASIVSYVSGRAGAQEIKYSGSSKYVDYYTNANLSKYNSYSICVINVEPNRNNFLEVTKHSTKSSLEYVTFSTGDRVIEDSKNKMFIVFKGLSASDTVKKGTYIEEDVYYKVSYKWARGYELYDISLPKTEKVREGTKYTVNYPSSRVYNFYTDNGKDTFYVYDDTVVYLTYEYADDYDDGGYAGSQMPLIDRVSESKLKEEIKSQMFENIDERYGNSVYDARVNVTNLKQGNDKDSVKFEVSMELLPASEYDINRLTIPDGYYDEDSGWILGKHNVGVLNSIDDEYFYVTDVGTGW